VKSVEAFLQYRKPEIVFSNFSEDLNIDHRLTAAAVLTACRPSLIPSIRGLFQFQTVSSSEWNYGEDRFAPNFYVDVSETFQFKIEALNEYAQEINQFPHPRSLQAVEALATLTGSEAGVQRAESFIQRYYIG
jgi:LmbE family N-acetylglucosaminyl deacetylase